MPLQRRHPALDFRQNIRQTLEVFLGLMQFVLSLLATRFVFRHSRHLLEQVTATVSTLTQNLLDHSQLEDAVTVRAKAGVLNEVNDIFQSSGRTVQEVLASAVSKKPPLDFDLGVRCRQSAIAVVDGDRDLGHPDGFACRRSVEDDILHPIGT